MRIAPLFQAAINVVLIRVNTGTKCGRFDSKWFDRSWLTFFQHPNHHLSTTLDHPEDRWLLRGERAASAFPLGVVWCLVPRRPFSTLSGFLVPSNNVDFITPTSSVNVGVGFAHNTLA